MTIKIDVLLAQLGNPARRAIQSIGVTSLEELCSKKEQEIAALHGIGKHAMERIHKILIENGLRFQQ